MFTKIIIIHRGFAKHANPN